MLRYLFGPAIAVFLGSALHAGGRAREPAMNPVRHASRSGDAVLFMDPTEAQGRGRASYVLRKGGKVVWSETKPYTLYHATVAEDGTLAGFSYSHGIEGHAKDRSDRSPGSLRLHIIGPDGRDRLDQAIQRTDSRYLHADPEPLVGAVGLDPASDIAMFEIVQPSSDEERLVWAFGAKRGERRPSSDASVPVPAWICTTVDDEPVRGTPLVLSRWVRLERRGDEVLAGARFTLRDATEATVWSWEVPNDSGQSDAIRLWDVWRRARQACLRLGNAARGRFEIVLLGTSERLSFEVARDGGGAWDVQEVGRAPHTMPQHDEWTDALPEAAAASRGEVILEAEARSSSPIRDVLSFDFDDRGRLGLARKDPGGTAIVILGADRKVALEAPMDGVRLDEKVGTVGTAWIHGDRWLVYVSPSGVQARSRAWWVRGPEGKPEPIEGFDCPSIEALDGTGAGGFVALGTRRYQYTSDSIVIAFDREARRSWTLEKDPTHPNHQFSRSGLAVLSDGRIALLSTARGTVDILDGKGSYQSTIRLEEAWGRRPNYASALAGDPRGGFLVEDFHGKSRAVLMGLRGEVVMALPKCEFPGGRSADLRHFRVDFAGAVWGTDGSCIARVTAAGVVDEVLGSPPSEDALETVAAACMDTKDNIYCADERSGSVHVFDSMGRRLRVLKPEPGDFGNKLSMAHLTASDEGAVYLADGLSKLLDDPEYLLFSPSGERTGKKQLPLGEFKQDWYAQPSTGRSWVVSYDAVYLVDSSGKPVREIRKQPDGRWIEPTRGASVAPDGSIAVLAQPSWMLPVVNLYSAEGDPIRTIPLPRRAVSPGVAWDGRRIVILFKDGAALLDPEGGPARRLRLPDGEVGKEAAASWCFLPGHAPDELWLLDAKTRGIRRLGLP